VTESIVLGRPAGALGVIDLCTWIYGTTDFHFTRDIHTFIHCDGDDLFNGGPSLRFDPWKRRPRMLMSELKAILDGNQIAYVGGNDPHGPAGLRSWSIQNR
jgi:hypothetical protein